MKRLAIIILALSLVPAALFAQDKEIKKLFNQYEDKTGFSMDSEDPELNIDLDGNFSEFLNNIDNLYILTFENDKGNKSDRDAFETRLLKLSDKKGFKTILDIEGDGAVKMLSRKNKSDETTDFLMITRGDEESMYFWAASN